MANWERFNENLTQGVNSILAQKMAERNRQTGLSDALQKMIMEAQVKAQFDPEAQFRQQILEMLSGGQGQPRGQAQNGMTQGGIAPRLKGMNLGGMSFEFPQTEEEFRQETRRKAEQESQIAEAKPLSAEGAIRYSGAVQGTKDVNDILKILGLTKEGKVKNIGKAKNIIYKANLNIEGTGAKPTIVPFVQGAYKGVKVLRGGDEGAKVGNLFMTLAENLLRARTGAAAPEPEIVREYARSLLKSFVESPETWVSKLKQNEEFLTGIIKEMRPTKWKESAGLNQSKYSKLWEE